MNFQVFPVEQTTIFPIANSQRGGQLLTERNQLLRSSVANHSVIPYVCGPSYTHSLDDFTIGLSSDKKSLTISGGTAIVHGHFIELDKDYSISISLSELTVSGNLAVGLKVMYSGESTAAASMLTEGSDTYKGIQVVILPEASFKLPEGNGTSPTTPESAVTAHLKLGTFTYNAGTVTNLVPNAHRHEVIDGERISNLDSALQYKYVTRTGLNPKKLYTMKGFSSATTDPNDYWTDSTGALIQWDANPELRKKTDTVKSIWLKNEGVSGSVLLDSAEVRYDSSDDQLKMVLPHQEMAGLSLDGTEQYYAPVEIPIPAANRATGEGGVLDKSWVNFLNGLDNKIATMYRMPGGKMRKFIDVLTDRSELPQPPIAYYTEQAREVAYYDNRLQYSFNLLQTQVAQLNTKFVEFESNLENAWKTAVTDDVTATVTEQTQATQNSIDNVRSDIAALQSLVSNFQGDVSSVAGSIANSGESIETQLETLDDRVTKLENRWPSDASASDSESEGGGESEDDRITELEAKIAKLQNTISTFTASMTSTQTQVLAIANTTSSNLDTLYQSLYGVNKDGSSGDIKDASAAIEQLRSQYEYLYDAVHDLYDGIESEVQKATSSLRDDILTSLRSDIQAQIASIAEQYNVTANWAPGDYVLVAQDQTVSSEVNQDATTFPSTMYVVVPGLTPLDSKYVASYFDVYETDLSTPINRVSSTSSTSTRDSYSDALDTYNSAEATIKRQVPSRFAYGYELGSNDVQDVESAEDLPDIYNSSVMIDELYNSTVMINGVRGTPGKDYFVLRYRYPVEGKTGTTYVDEVTGERFENVQYQVYHWVSVFFTLNLVNDKIELDVDNPIILSGGTPYAEEERVGGFLNVGSDVYGGGYVSRDEAGHLRLNDFELLAAGVSAYQLGEDRTEGTGLDLSELQEIFDQYVNQRIAFPNDSQLYKAAENNLRNDVITIDININSTSEGVLNIYDIDSRFNTAVNLKITGSATENAVINIKNCQRIKITLDQTSAPTIILDNVCLYYDADVMDRIASMSNLTLWYQPWNDTDPPLEIDGMTVIYQGKLEPKGTKNFWTYASGNDNSYAYALRQLTFASDGTIIGMGLAVTDNTTSNIQANSESIFASTFTLPQSIGLAYPITKLTKQLKVTGNFITAYATTNSSGTITGYNVKNTNFTALTQKYLTYTDVHESIQGVISFYTRTSFIADAEGVNSQTLIALSDEFAIDGWESGAYHIFYGGAIE